MSDYPYKELADLLDDLRARVAEAEEHAESLIGGDAGRVVALRLHEVKTRLEPGRLLPPHVLEAIEADRRKWDEDSDKWEAQHRGGH